MQKNNIFHRLSFNLLIAMSILLTACGALPAAAAQPTALLTQAQAPSPVVTAVPIPTIIPNVNPTQQPTQAPVTLQIAVHAKLGSYLTDQNGHTLYVFIQDSQGASNCYGSCATYWGPLSGTASAGSGVKASLIGTSRRKDGTPQINYNGYPLYTFSQDSDPGDMYGQGLQKFWYVISPAGKILKTAVSKPADAVQFVSAASSAMSLALNVTHSSKYGALLTDKSGHTLYLFTQDSGGTSNCTGSCAALWPPVSGPVSAGKGVNPALVGSIQRQDGSFQVTYGGHPLYEFVQDTKAGMLSGEGAQKEFYLVSPTGSAIKTVVVQHSTHAVTIQPTPMAAPRNMMPQPMPRMPMVPMGGTRY
ncbi:MAG: hypothetical protein P4L50_27260 [Anaerolineaceae bacterium]|nr:hypothetical protein [Anaerolineaceae bacterium]